MRRGRRRRRRHEEEEEEEAGGAYHGIQLSLEPNQRPYSLACL